MLARFLLAAALLGVAAGCGPNKTRSPARIVPPPAGDALVYTDRKTDGHVHGDSCGCSARVHLGNKVFRYRDRWEFFDPADGTWYYFEDG